VKDFEFLHNITIGQYLPTGSAVHMLHPATKMLSAALLVVVLVVCTSLSGIVLALVLAGIALAAGRVPLKYAARGIRPAVPIIVFVAVLQILFISSGDVGPVLWQGWIITITARDFYIAAVVALRLIALIERPTSGQVIVDGDLHRRARSVVFRVEGHAVRLVAVVADAIADGGRVIGHDRPDRGEKVAVP
jgi:hypothetical protein